jgi:hypothetical protein
MESYTEEQLMQIVDGFLDRSLDKTLWTHHAHIITAIWHLIKYDKEDALCRLRSGIISYNLAVGGKNDGQNGYHETMTIFWWDVINQYLTKNPGDSYHITCNKFLATPMTDKTFPFQFYSKENILSPVARSRYVPPDLKEIKI